MDLAARELGRLGPPEIDSGDVEMEDEAYHRPTDREKLQDALGRLPDVDELRDENDILFIANQALMEGVVNPADMLKWMARKESLAKMGRPSMWVDDNKYRRPPPRVQQIAKYLRWCEENAKKFAPR